MRPLSSIFHIAFFGLCAACGGRQVADDAGVDGATCVNGAYAVCGGPLACAPPSCQCTQQVTSSSSPTTGICSAPLDNPWAYPFGDACYPGVDGRVCVLITLSNDTIWADAPFEVGQLLAADGATDRVRYADLGLWTGDPIPQPTSCPNLGNVKACGGACGDCSTGGVCVGRSPLHPVGFCDTNHYVACSATPSQQHPGCSTVGDACFTYVVQPQAQGVADNAGKCLPAADCQALAAAIPGGGTCTITK